MDLLRIAMWSGPRNISTAMMRSWENRKDTVVVDEPLYGPYLAKTGKKHPCYQEIIKAQGENWQPIVEELTAKNTTKNFTKKDARLQIFYQKHMTHHILPDMQLDWVKSLKNVFLIRHPDDVLSSYLKKHENPQPEDLGYPQQVEIFKQLKQQGETPLVIESKDVLKNPEKALTAICESVGVKFDPQMLNWPKGYRDSDGVWAEHWYNRVIQSTGFAEYQPKQNTLTKQEQKIADQCLPYFEHMAQYKWNG